MQSGGSGIAKYSEAFVLQIISVVWVLYLSAVLLLLNAASSLGGYFALW